MEDNRGWRERERAWVIKGIKMRVMEVGGSENRVNPNLAARMKGTAQANVKFVVVEDAGHFFRDLFGEDLADAVAEFVGAGGE